MTGSVGRARRAVVGLAAVAALLGAAACSDDDDEGGFPAALADDAQEAAEAAEGTCKLLAAADLEAITGTAFQPGDAAEGTCTYRGPDGRTTVTVNVTDLPADAALALETTSSTCDAGTATDRTDVSGATGAFTCTVSGVQVAAGTSTRTYAVVMGAGLADADPGATLARVLGAVLTAAES